MDLRIKKTLRNIRESFIDLAKEKPVDDITVKELCERAMINKATFYLHYENMDELIKMLEDEFVQEITGKLDFADLFYTDPEQFLLKLWQSYRDNANSAYLMRGRRGFDILNLLLEALRRSVESARPEIRNIPGADMALTFCVYGIASVGPRYRKLSLEERARQTGRAITAILKEFELLV